MELRHPRVVVGEKSCELYSGKEETESDDARAARLSASRSSASHVKLCLPPPVHLWHLTDSFQWELLTRALETEGPAARTTRAQLGLCGGSHLSLSTSRVMAILVHFSKDTGRAMWSWLSHERKVGLQHMLG